MYRCIYTSSDETASEQLRLYVGGVKDVLSWLKDVTGRQIRPHERIVAVRVVVAKLEGAESALGEWRPAKLANPSFLATIADKAHHFPVIQILQESDGHTVFNDMLVTL